MLYFARVKSYERMKFWKSLSRFLLFFTGLQKDYTCNQVHQNQYSPVAYFGWIAGLVCNKGKENSMTQCLFAVNLHYHFDWWINVWFIEILLHTKIQIDAFKNAFLKGVYKHRNSDLSELQNQYKVKPFK